MHQTLNHEYTTLIVGDSNSVKTSIDPSKKCAYRHIPIPDLLTSSSMNTVVIYYLFRIFVFYFYTLPVYWFIFIPYQCTNFLIVNTITYRISSLVITATRTIAWNSQSSDSLCQLLFNPPEDSTSLFSTSSHLRRGRPRGLFPSGFSANTMYRSGFWLRPL